MNLLTTQQPLKQERKSAQSLENFHACLTKFEKQQILLNKISHKFLVTTKSIV
jgi:hypothetical protein